MNELFEYLNEHIAIVGVALVLVLGAMAVILAVDSERRKRRNEKIGGLEYALETKEQLIVHKDKEIWDLKVELFKAREDKKISDRKKDAEISRLTTKIEQLVKWGSEK